MKDKLTFGEKYGPAMELLDEAAARAYFEELVGHTMRMRPCGRDEAVSIERSNLGYYAGYYDEETRRRVERLFSCAHPVFGSIEQKGAPTAQQAFDAGVNLAKERS